MTMSKAFLAAVTVCVLSSVSTAVRPTSLRGDSLIGDLIVNGLGRCDSANRTDCGYYGINQQQCQAKGCCWQPTSADAPEDTPWCFFQSEPSPSCATTPQCSGHGSCTDGSCVCSTGYSTCGNVTTHDCSVNTDSDPLNCGSCGRACPSGPGVASSACDTGKCDVQCAPGYTLCYGDCSKGSNCSASAPFTPDEYSTVQDWFINNLNIEGQGGVVAAPSTSDPDYYYAWQRDAAISMREYMNIANLSSYQTNFESYVSWVNRVQGESDPNGIDVRGEPKFFLPGGAVYNQGWCRPQNDGPALRTIARVAFANVMIANGNEDYVRQNIYPSDASQPGIQKDLEYVQQVWNQDSCDPWEEVRGQVFFDKFVMRKALLVASDLATKLGDSSSASSWKATAATIQSNIQSTHWNGKIIMEVPSTRELDSATHLGVLYGTMDDGFLDPSSSEVQSSVAALVTAFEGYADFTINAKDTANGVPGLMVGRYLNDHYNGGNPSQPSGGNPWILCTLSLGEIYYRAASLHSASGKIAFDDINVDFWRLAVKYSAYSRPSTDFDDETMLSAIVPGQTITLADNRDLFKSLANALTLTGDAFLLRIKYHVSGVGFNLHEQLNKDTGFVQGATKLTWSAGTLIGAMTARASSVDTVAAL